MIIVAIWFYNTSVWKQGDSIEPSLATPGVERPAAKPSHMLLASYSSVLSELEKHGSALRMNVHMCLAVERNFGASESGQVET